MVCSTLTEFLKVLGKKAPIGSRAQVLGTLPEGCTQVRLNFTMASDWCLGDCIACHNIFPNIQSILPGFESKNTRRESGTLPEGSPQAPSHFPMDLDSSLWHCIACYKIIQWILEGLDPKKCVGSREQGRAQCLKGLQSDPIFYWGPFVHIKAVMYWKWQYLFPNTCISLGL